MQILLSQPVKYLSLEQKKERMQTDNIPTFTVVIGNDPREHWVLVKVIVGPSGQRVDMHQILKVRNLSGLPTLRDGLHTNERQSRVQQPFSLGLNGREVI